MRLTLRTLLAYLDDVLDPADKEELSHKIDTSDFAKDLMHRTRDSVRRLRLSAPQVVGTGMAMDPNTVAEYLDNSLPPDQVGDYERICLDSDLHLAETAACHHVLTMVLGEPAEVEPRARQRMYMVPAEARERRKLRAEPAHKRPGTATTVPIIPPLATQTIVASSAAPPADVVESNAYEIPEYLRSKSWWKTWVGAAALAALVLIGAATYFVLDNMGVFGGTQEVAAVGPVDIDAQQDADAIAPKAETTTPEITAPTTEADVATSEPGTAPVEPITGAMGVATPPPAETAVAPVDGDTPPATSPVPPVVVGTEPPTASGETAATPADPVVDPATAPSAPVEQSEALVVNTETEPRVESVVEAPVALPPQSADVATTNVTPPGAVDGAPPTSPPLVPPQESAESGESSATPPAEAVAAATPTAPVLDSGDAGSEATEEAGPPEVGMYLSGKTVLLRHDDAKGGWFRVQPRSAVAAGDRLLALPEFRPKLTLASGVMLDLSGGTQVVMRSPNGEQGAGTDDGLAVNPLIEIQYGRIVFTNTSNGPNHVRVKAGNFVGEATLERNATLGVEAQRQFVPGNDPRKAPSPVIVRMHAPEGGVTWKDATGQVTAEGASMWELAEGTVPTLVAETTPPDWIDQEPVIHLSEQKYGAPAVESALTTDRPVDIQLLELFKGRERREVKSLVTRASIHVGLFAPFIEALRDSDQKWQTWRTHIATLRTAMAQSPEAADAVYEALVEQRGRQSAGDLYEMLCGFNAEQIGTTPEQLKTGAIARLIDHLESDSLDYRVLAVHDLWEITGKQLMPNPSATPSTRKINVRNWRNRLEEGELEVVKRG
jgi:hypothetical protein